MLSENSKIIPVIGTPISRIGMGCWAIGGPFDAHGAPAGWGDVDDAQSTRAIHAAIDAGATLFDTADVYGTGHSELVLGQAIKGKRDKLVIASKFGNTFDEQTKNLTGTDVTPHYMEQALERSLERLDTDYIDILQLHVGDADHASMLVLADALERAVSKGKIRMWGWSTDDDARVKALPTYKGFGAVQLAYNLFDGNESLLSHAGDNGLLAFIRSPLAMGLLTGKFDAASRLPSDDIRASKHEWMVYFNDGIPNIEMLAKLDAVRELLRSDGRTLVQGALCWLMAKSTAAVPIPGFKSEKQALENIGAMEFGPLPTPVMQEIQSLLKP